MDTNKLAEVLYDDYVKFEIPCIKTEHLDNDFYIKKQLKNIVGYEVTEEDDLQELRKLIITTYHLYDIVNDKYLYRGKIRISDHLPTARIDICNFMDGAYEDWQITDSINYEREHCCEKFKEKTGIECEKLENSIIMDNIDYNYSICVQNTYENAIRIDELKNLFRELEVEINSGFDRYRG